MNSIRALDHYLSRKVHNSNLGAFELLLMPWGYLFQPPFVWVAPTLFGIGLLFYDKVYFDHVRWWRLTGMVIMYILAMIVNLYLVVKIKRTIGRDRPLLENRKRLVNL